jgi:NAD(P)-dependent dehydrogenase (short-subunit alcohol dehydrogenase family)
MIEHDHGGAIVLTSSVAGLRAYGNLSHYVAAKHGVVGLMRSLAIELAPFNIRVNSIHPTQTNTPMLMNDATIKLFSDAEMPTREGFRSASQRSHLLPVPWIEPIDVSNALLFLVSDEARYVTGVALPVDAGSMAR